MQLILAIIGSLVPIILYTPELEAIILPNILFWVLLYAIDTTEPIIDYHYEEY